jgi:predicted nucleic acid-binding protein
VKQIFADTSYWIALVNPRDQIRAKAISATRQLSWVRVVTTEMVLVELLNSFSDAGPFRYSVGGMVEKLRADGSVTIVPQTSEQFEQAFAPVQAGRRQGLEPDGLREFSGDGSTGNSIGADA